MFSRVDLQAVMKTGRLISKETITSFYLRELCPQADALHKVGPMVASGKVIQVTPSWKVSGSGLPLFSFQSILPASLFLRGGDPHVFSVF